MQHIIFEKEELHTALTSVSCTSSTSCVAAGKSTTNPTAFAWNGKEWIHESMPFEGKKSTEASLTGVSCHSSTSCVAVGTYKGEGGLNPFSEIYN